MAGSLNEVNLIGNVGKDPEAKSFQNGGEIVNFSIATSESWKDKQSGERKEKVEWHNITVTNEGLCKVAKQYIRKGSKVFVSGQLQTRKWQDQNGNDRWSTEIALKPFGGKIILLDKKDDGAGQSSGYGGGSQGGGGGTQSGGSPFDSDLDDSVPF